MWRLVLRLQESGEYEKNRLVGGEHDFFLYIGNNNPNLTFIFFRGIETTNQVSVLGVRLLKGLDILLSLGIIKIFTAFHMCILIFPRRSSLEPSSVATWFLQRNRDD